LIWVKALAALAWRSRHMTLAPNLYEILILPQLRATSKIYAARPIFHHETGRSTRTALDLGGAEPTGCRLLYGWGRVFSALL